MQADLTHGPVTPAMLRFAAPMIAGNLLQQLYYLVDTLIVGRCLGPDALAAVGSAYALMTFLTSVLLGLCMGGGAVCAFHVGRRDWQRLSESVQTSFLVTGAVTLAVSLLVFGLEGPILRLLQTPEELMGLMGDYVHTVYYGLVFVFLYQYFAYLLRAVGNASVPLFFLGAAAVGNVGLDLLFVLSFDWGIRGAALATVLAQGFSGLGIGLYTWLREPSLRLWQGRFLVTRRSAGEMLRFSLSTSAQQSVMNLGILMVQGLVNSFGTAVMAAFAAGVKIDSLAYMPAQEFGNAFSLFLSQNHGAGKEDRIRQGVTSAFRLSAAFCAAVSAVIFFCAHPLLTLFIDPSETEILAIGVEYLRIEGAFYWGIGMLFLFYGYFRGISRPEVSLLLTVISLGTRVALAYLVSPIPAIGTLGIWWAIPIGWLLADGVGGLLLLRERRRP